MSWSRRDVLATLGIASGSAILFACGGQPRRIANATEIDPEIRTWLRDAVAALAGAGLEQPHALAVSRRRTAAAIDVLGAGVGRGRCDGVVLSVRDRSGLVREQVSNDLSRDGVLAAVKALVGGKRALADLSFGAAPAPLAVPVPDPDALSDGQMLARVEALAARDKSLSSRIVYSAASLDIDDSRVWSVAPGRMLEQRLVRVRRALTRVAWHGTRPFVSEAVRAWTGGIDAHDLTDDDVIVARENALALLSPQAFEDKEYAFVLEPAVAAALIDAGVRTLLTSEAQRRPDITKRLAVLTKPVSEHITIVDDPTVAEAYGGYRFDDSGSPATARTLVERGTLVGRVERSMRPGHVGPSVIMPSHIRVVPGTVAADAMLDNGMLLEGHTSTLIDPSSDRFVIQCARAREQLGGSRTGRMFADVELVGELTKLFGSLGALSKEMRSIGWRDEIDGQPRHRSIDAPWLRGVGQLRQRRRPA